MKKHYLFILILLLDVDSVFALTFSSTVKVEPLSFATRTVTSQLVVGEPTATPNPFLSMKLVKSSLTRLTQTGFGADLSLKGRMKDHFRKGMKFFIKDNYNKAIPELIASTMIADPDTWNYWYAEAYSTLGVIYEFHSNDPNHKKLAYQYYSLALKRDPKTKSANYYIDRVRPKVKRNSKSKPEKLKKSDSSAATPVNQ